ncbi:outer membrane protein assembly factor BamD [Acidocella sp.]|uniref:outer membrane protein assembly factor BamD n=1 Tax=Acidocella sp. TaxID=50710 RepID=UPI003CFD0A3B
MTHLRSGLARLSLLALGLALAGCSSPQKGDAALGDFASGTLPPPDQAYAVSVARMQKGDYSKAVKDFNALQETYPYSTWSTHAEILGAYAQYKQMDYDDAISSLNRFIQLHPQNDEIAYAYYLKSLCYYEQIDGVQRQQTSTYEAIQALQDVISRFPNSAYASDARIKLRLAYNRLAGHDMAIGRYYEKQHLYAAAIGRYQDVANTYQTTTYAPEALERMVEVDLDLGLPDAAIRSASVLGYNYPGSSWYVAAYDKLKSHGLVNKSDESSANSDAVAPPPAPKRKHPWYWPF